MRNKKERGFTLIELILTAAIMSGLLLMMVQSTLEGVERMRDRGAVEHLKQVEEAVKLYVKDHDLDIKNVVGLGQKAEGDSIVVNGSPLNISTLISQGYLRSGFRSTNTYGQSYAFVVRHPFTDLLEFMAYTIDGEVIDADRAAGMAARLGASGGVFEDNGGGLEVQGAFGGWRVQNSDWSSSWGAPSNAAANRLVAVNASLNGHIISDYLARVRLPSQGDTPNTMLTTLRMGAPLVMNANNIDNAGAITAASLGADTVTAASLTVGNATSIIASGISIGGTSVTGNAISTGTIGGGAVNISSVVVSAAFTTGGGTFDTNGEITVNKVTAGGLLEGNTMNTNILEGGKDLAITGGTIETDIAVVGDELKVRNMKIGQLTLENGDIAGLRKLLGSDCGNNRKPILGFYDDGKVQCAPVNLAYDNHQHGQYAPQQHTH